MEKRSNFPLLKSIPKEHIPDVYNYLMSMNASSSGIDFREAKLRPVFRDRTYPLIVTIFCYAALVLVGLLGNGGVFYMLWKKGTYKRANTLACVLNMTVAFILQLTFVVPLTLFVILIDNWVLGSFLCHLLPMIQDIPGYSLMMTITILSFDRRRFLFDPKKGSIPVRWAIGLSWIISVGLVLPYSGYIVFIDLSTIGTEFQGGQLCIVSLSGKASTYIKTLFIFFYAVPMIASLVFLRKTSKIIRQREMERSGYRNETLTSLKSLDTNSDWDTYSDIDAAPSSYRQKTPRHLAKRRSISETSGLVNVQKEKRSQKFLYLIIVTYFVCLFPLNILKVVRQLVMETYDNANDFDVTYIVVVWIAFLPTAFVPWYFAQWIFLGERSSRETLTLLRKGKFDEFQEFPAVRRKPEPSVRMPTPPPPPSQHLPKKSRKNSKTNQNGYSSVERGLAEFPDGFNNPGPVSLSKCTCGRGANRNFSPHSHAGLQAKTRKSQVLNGGVVRRHSYQQLKLTREEQESLIIPSRLSRNAPKNWTSPMNDLCATEV